MKADDFWIGEHVILLKSNRLGIVKGTKEGRVKVKVGDKIILSLPSNLKIHIPPKKHPLLEAMDEESQPRESLINRRLKFKAEIDLHIEKLQHSKKNDNPIAILEFQLRKLTAFLDDAIDLGIPKVNIIHGKGTGALKQEVYNIFKDYQQIKSLYPTNQDGAVIVYFKI